MGFNAEKCGYDNAYTMFEEFADNEDSHIFAIVKYLLRSGGRDELQSENCYGLRGSTTVPGR
jgi:rubrerythrin